MLTVFRNQSTFKGAKETDVFYTATLENGQNAIITFVKPLPDEFKDLKCFIISEAKGNIKTTEVMRNGIEYTNNKIYIDSCKFEKMPVEDLPF